MAHTSLILHKLSNFVLYLGHCKMLCSETLLLWRLFITFLSGKLTWSNSNCKHFFLGNSLSLFIPFVLSCGTEVCPIHVWFRDWSRVYKQNSGLFLSVLLVFQLSPSSRICGCSKFHPLILQARKTIFN